MEIEQAPRDFVDELETKLVSAADRLESRRRAARRGIVVAGILAAVLAGGTVGPFTGSEGGLRPALAIESEPETVRIRLLGEPADPGAVREELAAAGIDADVEAIPVSPSLEGTWVTAELPAGGNVEVVAGGTLVARQPVGSLRLIYGRAAEAGEGYHVTTSAFAPGEALHCVELLGKQAGDVASVLGEMGLGITWRHHLPGETRAIDEPPPGVVVGVTPDALDQVFVFVADPAIADQFTEPVDRTGCS